MSTYLLERGLYGAMAAVLIVPELATFVVFIGFSIGLLAFFGSFTLSLLRDSDAPYDAELSQEAPSLPADPSPGVP